MRVQDGQIPAYLVAKAGPVVVAMCTACERRTLRPSKAMMDRHGSIITDGCGDCEQDEQDGFDEQDIEELDALLDFLMLGDVDPERAAWQAMVDELLDVGARDPENSFAGYRGAIGGSLIIGTPCLS